MEHFFSPNSDEDQIEKGLHQKWNTFCPNSSRDLRSDAHQSQIVGGNADEDHTQNVGGHISLLSPRVSAPLGEALLQVRCCDC